MVCVEAVDHVPGLSQVSFRAVAVQSFERFYLDKTDFQGLHHLFQAFHHLLFDGIIVIPMFHGEKLGFLSPKFTSNKDILAQ